MPSAASGWTPDNAQAVAVPDDEWHYVVWFSNDGTPIGFKLLARDSAKEVTARSLRAIPFGKVMAEARRRLPMRLRSMTRHPAFGGEMDDEELAGWVHQVDRWEGAFRETPRPGRAGRPLVEYARIAADYVALSGSGTATRDLAEKRGYSTRQVRAWLTRARDEGLLTRAPRGRSGGELTEKALELLKGEDDGSN